MKPKEPHALEYMRSRLNDSTLMSVTRDERVEILDYIAKLTSPVPTPAEGGTPEVITDWQPPEEIVRAAHEIDKWMQTMGWKEWQLGPCAARASVERAERERDEARRERDEALRDADLAHTISATGDIAFEEITSLLKNRVAQLEAQLALLRAAPTGQERELRAVRQEHADLRAALAGLLFAIDHPQEHPSDDPMPKAKKLAEDVLFATRT